MKTSDEEAGEVSQMCKALGITVHVRGPDDRIVVEYRDKFSRRVVGGIELKRRMEAYLKELSERRG